MGAGERGTSFATYEVMSKHQPNQDFYKIGGREQTDGPDRADANVNADKHRLAQNEKQAKDPKHPELLKSKKRK